MQGTTIDNYTLKLVREYMPTRDSLESLSEFFSALGDVTRMKIISALAISTMCVNDLSHALGLNQTTVSHQLKNLRSCGIVKVNRQGKVAFYSLSRDVVVDVVNKAVEMV